MSTEPNPTPCRACNYHGFTINRADHAKHLKSEAWRKVKGPTHQFEQMLVAPDPQVLAECGGCHYLARSEFQPVVDISSRPRTNSRLRVGGSSMAYGSAPSVSRSTNAPRTRRRSERNSATQRNWHYEEAHDERRGN